MHAYKRPEPIKRQDNQRGLEIIFRSRAELKPDPANPRRHSKKQIMQIAKSIRVFGFNVPVLVDRDSNVIAGHGRLLACGELGIDEVPTSCLEHLTPAQTRAFRIADNKLTENATWDDRLLAEQLRDLSLSGLDFDIEVTGFEMGEIDLRIASLEDTPAPGSDPADILPEVSVAPLVSKFGDLWLLGRHRVRRGNALDPKAIPKLASFQLVLPRRLYLIIDVEARRRTQTSAAEKAFPASHWGIRQWGAPGNRNQEKQCSRAGKSEPTWQCRPRSRAAISRTLPAAALPSVIGRPLCLPMILFHARRYLRF